MQKPSNSMSGAGVTRTELLAQINEGLPDLDWKKGARDYVAEFCSRYTTEQIEEFIFTKPLGAVTPEDPSGALLEISSYLFNFASAIRLLNLPRGARVLDIACGGGWFSHWLRKIGYDARGLDISEDFVQLARKRLQLDPHLTVDPAELERIYRVHDLEEAPLPADLRESCDAVVLESCLHHFYDPITALEHIRAALKPSGVILILEGENRQGPIRQEYVDVMLDTATLERPYPREQLRRMLAEVGIGHVEFLGALPGFFAESAPEMGHMTEVFGNCLRDANICICGTSAEALARVVPTYVAESPDQATSPGCQALAEAGPCEELAAAAEAPADVVEAPADAMTNEGAAKARTGFPVHPRAALRAGWRAFWGRGA